MFQYIHEHKKKKKIRSKKTSFTRYSLIWKGKVGGAIVGMLISKYTHTQNRTMRSKWGLVYMPLTFHWKQQAEIASYFIFFMMTMNSEFWDYVTRSNCSRILLFVSSYHAMIRTRRRNDLDKHSFIFQQKLLFYLNSACAY